MLYSKLWVLLPLLSIPAYSLEGETIPVKTQVFRSPPFYLTPGLVQNKFYHDIPFPRGHIALKSFEAEVVDNNGDSVPLHETYLHHWVVERYYSPKGVPFDKNKFIVVANSGPCSNIGQYFGLGSETRKTDTWIPDPYGIQVGNPAEIPEGYEEKWLLNVHAIDTRGVENRLGCTECKCSLYNVTEDEYSQRLPEGYIGGLRCCYDETQCSIRRGFRGGLRKLYLRYTVKWTEWSSRILPVKIYILDVTDAGGLVATSITAKASPLRCKVEYTVPSCSSSSEANGDCIDARRTKVVLPHGGDIIYGVSHQHTGGISSALYGEDGDVLCSSKAIYGRGEEAGDEAGYIVGMSTCYPNPGTVNIKDGELLTLVFNYSSAEMHNGVMGLFYLLLAEPQPKLNSLFSLELKAQWFADLVEHGWGLWLAGGFVGVAATAIYYRRRERQSYQMISSKT